MKTCKPTLLALLFVIGAFSLCAQNKLLIEGNGQFFSESSTNVDLLNTLDNTNALIRFGDNNLLKSALGFNGNEDVFKISMGNTLGREDFTLSQNGRIGINFLPTTHRFLIHHNSTSGTDGSAHLALQENNTSDFARLRFQNEGDNGLWVIASRATNGNSLMNFFYNDGNDNFANLMSFDGDNFLVGIHQTQPNAYLHIKQASAGVDALKFENDDSTGGEIWGWRVGDNDILIYFEGALRASIDSDNGSFTNFPPPVAFARNAKKVDDNVLDDVLKLKPIRIPARERSQGGALTLNPQEVERINPDWVRYSEDGQHVGLDFQGFTLLAIKSIQEQQQLIVQQKEEIQALQAEKRQTQQRLNQLEEKIQEIFNHLATTDGEESITPPLTVPDSKVTLEQNTPNPFKTETQIQYSLPQGAQNAMLQISDAQGQIVKTLPVDPVQSQMTVRATNLSPGQYYYTMIVDQQQLATKKFVVQ